MYYSTSYSSPLGELSIVSDGEAVCGVSFHAQKHVSSFDNLTENDDLPIFDNVRGWFDDYFRGSAPEIDFRLKPSGTDFRLKVWKILCEIPYGETVTYGEIASRISPSMSAQAVGGAVGHNPIAILIPCHRVIGTNGRLTGYAAGIDRKIALLKLENIDYNSF
jgi:methylated-DNA-[protein]-cysteine S-methyltransferase